MLLTNRRYRTLFIALAGMEVAWFIPWALTFFAWLQPDRSPLPPLLANLGLYSPWALFGISWGLMLLYLLGADLLNRWQIDSPLYEVALVGIVLGTALLLIRLLLFPTLAPWDLRWLAAVVSALFTTAAASSAILFLLVINLFLWLRVATATDRALTFFSVGMSFRVGMLLALVGNTLLILVARRPVEVAIAYFWLFFAFGLVAVAVARIDEKALGAAQSSGATLPWGRFSQLLLMLGATMTAAIAVAQVYTPTNVRTVLGWFSPLWNFLGNLFLTILYTVLWIIAPWLERLINFIRSLMADLEPQQQQEIQLGDLQLDQLATSETAENFVMLRYCLVALIITVVVIVLLLLFVRSRRRGLPEEKEESGQEGLALGSNPFARLRDLGKLLRRYGFGPGLLAAISVQNIYANVCRLAAKQGHPRAPAQSPDEYLSHLLTAFPTQNEAITRLTTAYMRVHYGDRAVDETELAQLRADYVVLQEETQ
ncbi:MAG: DUF4129 domain-containing protein [Caldilineaceae bacterium]|nr:DUF4129 domain-containing protein [Caldilineaceae bacterium]